MQQSRMATIEIAFLIVPLLLHLFGIFILCRTPSDNLGLTCKLFFVNLSLAEVTVCLFGILKRCDNMNYNGSGNLKYHATLVQYAIGYSLYYLVMMLLTLDRFFRVYLNLKFHLYWPERWNGKILMGCWTFACVLFAVFAMRQVSINRLNQWLFPVYDTMFLVISIITYTYIFVKVRGNRKKLLKSRPSSVAEDDSTSTSTTSNGIVHQNKQATKKTIFSSSKEFLSIFLLVITFQIFTVLPDFIYVYIELSHGAKMSRGLSVFVLFMYGMGYTVDFFIYTFSSKAVRNTFLKMFQS